MLVAGEGAQETRRQVDDLLPNLRGAGGKALRKTGTLPKGQ